ncbi:bifunctional alpha,alpha-trehalose-phosphate synthase (UDP-forming)/trehalose-phosphatase, partial [Spirochaetota bacterium]
MNRLLIISNRLPVSVQRSGDSFNVKQSIGGLATGLSSFYKEYDSVWIGWPGLSNEMIGNDRDIVIKKLKKEKCYPVFLSKKDLSDYYLGFCNNAIWPLFHYFIQYCYFFESQWETYKEVNVKFFNSIKKLIKPDDYIWVHDYQLLLLPQLIKEKYPNVKIGFFLHIPFPSFEVFRIIPWRREILEGMLGADLIGFHTYDYVRHFLSAVHRICGHEHRYNQILTPNHILKAEAFPMGVDYEYFSSISQQQVKLKKRVKEIRGLKEKLKIILSVDRLDYTKGMINRLNAYERFLDHYPEYKGKVTLITLAVPSRADVEQYQDLKKEVDETTGRINGKYGTIGWTPIRYLYKSIPFDELAQLYTLSDIALVTPLRDGMNLVAKEYIASKTDGKGVLILSEMTGAARELGEAIIVNPNDITKLSDSIYEAVTMPEEEQIARNRKMQKRIREYNVGQWAQDFIDNLKSVKELQKVLSVRNLNPEIEKKIIKRYRSSNKRVLFLDYDGTLVEFSSDPDKTVPDKKLLALLKKLAHDKKNTIIIVSERGKKSLDAWLGKLNIHIIAEHGALVKAPGGEWEIAENISSKWKGKIMPVLEVFVKRTPGAFIEEKDFSLTWHYKKAESDLKAVRARELKEALLHLTQFLHLEILEGNNIIEIKNIRINKGNVARKMIRNKKYGFILAIGDDSTDERMFESLPQNAFSINVGNNISKAKYNVKRVDLARQLLNKLIAV